MNYELKTKNGFSLTEVLFAVGILAVGMVFIAGVFPVAIRFVTLAAERSIAAVAADEAFAKIKLCGINSTKLVANQLTPVYPPALSALTDPNIDPNEFFYPSTHRSHFEKQYCWTALCGGPKKELPDLQVTVFVCRRNAAVSGQPVVPVKVTVAAAGRADELQISNLLQVQLINDGSTIVDDRTGQIYRVLERDADNPSTPVREDQIIRLDRNWQGGLLPGDVWVTQRQINGNVYNCIAVYQKIIRF